MNSAENVSNERLVEMLAGLEGVTPGPWNEGDKWVFVSPASGKPLDALESVLAANKPQANAAHIARCDPDTIRALILEVQALRSPPTEDGDRVEVWGSSIIDRLQRAIMDDDEAVRERAAENVAVLYAHSVAPYAAALAMVREAIGELFGPKASIESEDATLLRGPEPHHEAEAQIAALRRVSAPPTPETVGVSDAMVERIMAWVRDDVLPAYGITHDTRASDPEMIEGLTAALSPQEGE